MAARPDANHFQGVLAIASVKYFFSGQGAEVQFQMKRRFLSMIAVALVGACRGGQDSLAYFGAIIAMDSRQRVHRRLVEELYERDRRGKR